MPPSRTLAPKWSADLPCLTSWCGRDVRITGCKTARRTISAGSRVGHRHDRLGVSWKHCVLRVEQDRWVLETWAAPTGRFSAIAGQPDPGSADCVVRLGNAEDGLSCAACRKRCSASRACCGDARRRSHRRATGLVAPDTTAPRTHPRPAQQRHSRMLRSTCCERGPPADATPAIAGEGNAHRPCLRQRPGAHR